MKILCVSGIIAFIAWALCAAAGQNDKMNGRK